MMKKKLFSLCVALMILATTVLAFPFTVKTNAAQSKKSMYVLYNNTKVYLDHEFTNPNNYSPLKGTLNMYDEVKVIKETSKYAQIEHEWGSAYVSRDQLTELKPEYLKEIKEYGNYPYYIDEGIKVNPQYRGENSKYVFFQVYVRGSNECLKITKEKPYIIKLMNKANRKKYELAQKSCADILKTIRGEDSLKIRWKKTTNVEGYHIRIDYSRNENFDNYKTVTADLDTKTSKKIKNLKSNRKYFVRISYYKEINGIKCYDKKYSSVDKLRVDSKLRLKTK